MTRTRPCTPFSFASATILVSALLLSAGVPAGVAVAQERGSSGNFLDNLFSRGEQQGQQRQAPPQQAPTGNVAQADPGDLTVRLDRMENALRQLTGTIEKIFSTVTSSSRCSSSACRTTPSIVSSSLGRKAAAAARTDRANKSGQCAWRPARQSRPPLRRLRSIAASECAGCAACPRQSGRDRCARARARQPGWRSGRPRSRRPARSCDHGRKR